MAKTQEELKQLKQEYDLITAKLKELTEEELMMVTAGAYKKDIGSDKNAKVIFD